MFKFFIQLIDAMVYPLLMIIAIWLVFFIDHGYGLNLNFYGLRPKELRGLIGIISMPFLHGNFDHLFSNSIPLLLSLGFIFLYFKDTKWKIILGIYLSCGILTWLIATAPSNHIGASGLVYGFIAFLVTHAIRNKNKNSIAAAFILIFLYGSLIYGIFPEYGRLIGKNISWEGHLAGLISGLLFALIYRNQGPQKLEYPDEDEEDESFYFPIEDDDDEELNIRYHLKTQRAIN